MIFLFFSFSLSFSIFSVNIFFLNLIFLSSFLSYCFISLFFFLLLPFLWNNFFPSSSFISSLSYISFPPHLFSFFPSRYRILSFLPPIPQIYPFYLYILSLPPFLLHSSKFSRFPEHSNKDIFPRGPSIHLYPLFQSLSYGLCPHRSISLSLLRLFPQLSLFLPSIPFVAFSMVVLLSSGV